MVPLFIGTYSTCTGGSVLMKMCGGVDSIELSTGVGGGARVSLREIFDAIDKSAGVGGGAKVSGMSGMLAYIVILPTTHTRCVVPRAS